MGINSKIEWCDHTLNFWWGCTKVSAACRFCYAETWNKYAGRGRADWKANGRRWIRTAGALRDLEKIAAAAGAKLIETGERSRVFVTVCSP